MRSVRLVAVSWALVLPFPACSAEAGEGYKSTPIAVESTHQLQRVDARGLFGVLKALRGKGLLVNVWRST